MNIRKYFLVVFLLFWGIKTVVGQTVQQRNSIVENYSLNKIKHLSDHYAESYRRNKQEAYTYARRHNLPLQIEYENGKKSYLQRIDEHYNLIYVKTYNQGAAKTIGTDKLYPGGGLGLQLEGQKMTAGLWDGGRVKGTHELLAGKVTQKDNAETYDDHATHVAGTIVGKKLSSNSRTESAAKGMAYKAHLDAYDWENDLSEMFKAARNGLLVSTHSYGTDLNQIRKRRLKDILGRYDKRSKAVDKLAFQAPNYTIVNAAGNDRADNPNPDQGGYNLLAGDMSTAKNDIVVTAVDKVLKYTGPASVEMTSFSSWGPTNDNRIKPDISADGKMVLSSVATDDRGNPSDDSYAWYSGTSAAAPSVAGSILLLQELSAQLNEGTFLHSATIKALLVETAREAGKYPGPDPRFGWGLLNVAGAAQLMLDDQEGRGAFYAEQTLVNKEPYIQKIRPEEEEGLRVTIAWSDPPGKVQNSGDSFAVLVNDLDLRIKDSQGNVYFPWRLDENDYETPALQDDDNKVDNVEQVFIPNVQKGEQYTVTVSHKGDLENGKQDFSIAVTGIKARHKKEPSTPDWFILYPNPASRYVNLKLKRVNGPVKVAVFDMSGKQLRYERYSGNALNFDNVLDVSTLSSGLYFVQVRTQNKKGTKKLIVK